MGAPDFGIFPVFGFLSGVLQTKLFSQIYLKSHLSWTEFELSLNLTLHDHQLRVLNHFNKEQRRFFFLRRRVTDPTIGRLAFRSRIFAATTFRLGEIQQQTHFIAVTTRFCEIRNFLRSLLKILNFHLAADISFFLFPTEIERLLCLVIYQLFMFGCYKKSWELNILSNFRHCIPGSFAIVCRHNFQHVGLLEFNAVSVV